LSKKNYKEIQRSRDAEKNITRHEVRCHINDKPKITQYAQRLLRARFKSAKKKSSKKKK